MGMADFVITDTRPSQHILYRDILPASNKRKLALEFTAASHGDGTLLVSIDAPKICFIPDFLFALRDFITGCVTKSAMRSVPTPLPVTSQPMDTPTESDSGSLSYRVTISDMQFLLIQDATQATSNAMVLSIAQLVVAHEHIISLAARGGAVALCAMNDQSQALSLIQPLDLTFVMDTRSEDKPKVTMAATLPDMMVLRVSYHDIMVVLDIARQVMVSAGSSSEDAKRTMLAKTQRVLSQLDVSMHPATAPPDEKVRLIKGGCDCSFPSVAPDCG
jgi:vacuolar protein sorting-associated protein 13A/C